MNAITHAELDLAPHLAPARPRDDHASDWALGADAGPYLPEASGAAQGQARRFWWVAPALWMSAVSVAGLYVGWYWMGAGAFFVSLGG